MADVHCQDGEHNGRAGRNIEPCTNQTHAKATFSQTETSFDLNTIRVILMCNFLFDAV